MSLSDATFAVRLIEEKNDWETFLQQRPETNFLQSWNWGVFHHKLGKLTFPIGLFEGDTQIAAAMVIKEEAKRGKYLTVAGGPILDWSRTDYLEVLCTVLKDLAKKEGCQFVRIRPQEIDSPELRKTVQTLGFTESPMHVTADLTLQLDLTKSEDQLLAEMRKNTRYEVRQAEKLGITVKQSEDAAEIETFYEYQLELAKKHHFVPFSYSFLYEQFVTFAEDHQVQLFHAFHEDKLLASAFILFYHGEAVYHYGISTPANDKLPGSYACQWAAIKWAKEQSGLRYNFWGIAPQDQPNHRFSGVSLFKRGFGGQEVQYLPAHDLPVGMGYQVVKGFELLRKKLRKL